MRWSNDDRGSHRRFRKLFFINCVRDQGGKLQNSTKLLGKKRVSRMLLVYYVRLVAGARAEKLVDWLPFSFLSRAKIMNLLRYLLIFKLLDHKWSCNNTKLALRAFVRLSISKVPYIKVRSLGFWFIIWGWIIFFKG